MQSPVAQNVYCQTYNLLALIRA